MSVVEPLKTVSPRGNSAALLRVALYHYARVAGNGWLPLRVVRAALAATPEETVLDVGCGTGGYSAIVPGQYWGIDPDADCIAFARWRFGSPRRRFEVAEVSSLERDVRIDKAMMINCLHHLSDAQCHDVLARVARHVRHRLIAVDPDPDSSNPLQRFLLDHDLGAFIRSPVRQRALLAEHFRVVEEARFRNTPRTVVQTLFVCEPPA
jgi:SAM-dependent methyltransferase